MTTSGSHSGVSRSGRSRGFFANISFTARLALFGISITLILIAADYAILVDLPSHIAEDSIELRLREASSELANVVSEDRLSLRKDASDFLQDSDVKKAIAQDDESRLQLLASRMPGGTTVRLTTASESVPGSGIVTVNLLVDENDPQNVLFYRDVDDTILQRVEDLYAGKLSLGLELGGSLIARSAGFDRSLTARRLARLGAHDVTPQLREVTIHHKVLHVWGRPLRQDAAFQLYVLSTPGLEDAALGPPRRDIARTVTFMGAFTLLAVLLLGFVVDRSVRRLARNVTDLAHGEVVDPLPVYGRDAFAHVAESFNVLSHELALRIDQLEATATAFRQTVEAIDEGICTWASDGELNYWNRGAEQITGVARDMATGDDPVIDFLRRERTPGMRRVTLPVRRTGGGVVVDLSVTTMPDGGVLQAFRDISVAEALAQVQRNFMATASHELRTPITAIVGFTDSLANPELDLSEEQRSEFLTIVDEQAHQLEAIVEAFFSNHQLATERTEVAITEVDVAPLVESVLLRLRRKAPDDHIQRMLSKVEVNVDPSLAVHADERALSGALAAIIDNATKYGRLPISVTAQPTGGRVAILVSDEGDGIDLHHQTRIFDPFYRVDVDMKSGVGGAGLGLFTARKLVEAMKGVIRVRSILGQGSVFAIELPISAPPEHMNETLRVSRPLTDG